MDIYRQKMQFDFDLIPWKNQLKQLKDVTPEATKLFEENMQKNLHNIGLGNDFSFNMMPQNTDSKNRNRQMD